MNARTEFQVIHGQDGKPAFVVVPYEQFRRMKGGFTHGTVFVEWAGAAGTPPPAGAVELLHVPAERVVELGAVLSGGHPGRTSADEITVYKSTGHAIEDAAAARLVLDEAVAKGIGLRLPR